MKIRRVVTGHDEHGKAVFAADEELDVPAGLAQLWAADATISYPDAGAVPPQMSAFPNVGGFRYSLVHIPEGYDPATTAPPPELETPPPDGVAHFEPGVPGMHWTETIDLEMVVSGEIVLELDDGAEKVLRRGDVMIQNGTRHRWRNLTDEPVSFLAFIIGAHHDGIEIPTPRSAPRAAGEIAHPRIETDAPSLAVRRVVTGHDENGRAVFVADEELEAAPLTHLQLWGADETITYPDDGTPPGPMSHFPRPGGFRYSFINLPAGYDPANQPPPQVRDDGAPAPAHDGITHMDPDDPGMHWTETIDCELMVSGEIVLELDDGAEKVLHAGDIVIQNGTRHRWKNLTDEPASFIAFIVGAEHAGIGIPLAEVGGATEARS